MKLLLATTILIFSLTSCQDKTMQQLCKKWDCVKIDNLDPISSKTFTSAADSVAAAKIETALKELNWTFNKDHSYRCSVGDKTVTQGTYQLINTKTLECTSGSGNSVNTYTITDLTDDELVLSNRVNNVELVLHFKVH